MSKIRTVKPELFRHEQLFEAEQKSGFPLRLIFIALFTVVDAEGRFRWRPRQLKLDILPYDDINFNVVLSALVDFGFIQRYECDGEYYGYIPTWRKHQHINQREPESILPDPQCCAARSVPIIPIQNYSAPTPTTDRNMFAHAKTRPAQPGFNTASHAEKAINDETAEPNHSLLNAVESKINPISGKELDQELSVPNHVMHVHDLDLSMPDTAPHVHHPEAHSPASLEMEMEVEKEMEGKWKNIPPHLRTVPDPVVLVFEHWQRVMDHPRAVLDKQRRRFIREALGKGYSPNDLCQAITGCSLTPHNRGHNDRGERYDGLHLILRSADQIDRFIRNAEKPPRPGKAEQRLQDNLSAADAWLNQNPSPEAA